MMRRWLQAGLVALMAAAVGCADNSLESLVTNTNNQISQVASSYDNIKNRLDDYMKKMAGGAKDEKGPDRDLEEAVTEAKKLKELARALQILNTQTAAVTNLTDEKKTELREKFQGKIDTARGEVVKAHREMKASLDKAMEKHEHALQPLVQALSESQAEFAAIVRRR